MSNKSNWFIQCDNAAYRRTSVSAAVVMHARARVEATGGAFGFGTDLTAKPATAASGHRTWSPPNC
jgi:hypothetical protein